MTQKNNYVLSIVEMEEDLFSTVMMETTKMAMDVREIAELNQGILAWEETLIDQTIADLLFQVK